MVTNNLLTAADLQEKAHGSYVVLPRGTIVTPGAYDYAREHSIKISFDNEARPDEVGRRVVDSVLREYEAATGRKPSREEAVAVVEAVVKKALAGVGDCPRK